MTAATARPQTAMKRLAGALSFVCLVLFLLAIEQRQTVEAWETVRAGAAPVASRAADWAGDLPSKSAEGFRNLRSAVARQTAAWRDSRSVAPEAAEAPGSPGGAAVQAPSAGSLTLVGAELRLGNGETLRTRPLRIAWGRETFAAGQTFAAQLDAPADAQIELREIVVPAPGQAIPASSLCSGDPARAAALLQRRGRTQLMLFRTATVGPETLPMALCGVWSFPAR
ncbi:hypothetical protein N0B44_26485 [Roseibacterium beibuensis]|uniref:hypothetical protein n=1 Tax=[Roseibacterium] beibuensis TaxID=1193142 RepID=UPI00217D0527|nr:hypothetical protein [Roseibacterium beibuensis]MCS6626475.1 hypothetical protein [Roseibacterium beibuensis]